MSAFRERAAALRAQASPHINCAQAVAVSFASAAGADEETVMRLAMGLGAVMTLGLFGLGDPETLRIFHDRFREKSGGLLDCSELLARGASLGLEKKPYCDGLVLLAVDLTEDILKENGKLPTEDPSAKDADAVTPGGAVRG